MNEPIDLSRFRDGKQPPTPHPQIQVQPGVPVNVIGHWKVNGIDPNGLVEKVVLMIQTPAGVLWCNADVDYIKQFADDLKMTALGLSK